MRAILVGRAEQRPGDLAGDHVDLVARGQRDEEVGALAARGEQRRRVGALPEDRADVEPVLQLAQDLVARVDDGDVIRLLAREAAARPCCRPGLLPG
jgi:hypothetical protein